MWIISLLLVLFAPFFLYVFAPLLRFNIWAGALSGGIFIGFVFLREPVPSKPILNVSAAAADLNTVRPGCSAVWAGRCVPPRQGCFSTWIRPVFWMGSGCALLLVLLVALARPGTSQTAMVMNALGANSPVISAGMVFSLFRMRQMWMFVLYMIGVACVYDVFDQQFATFFRAFLTRRRRDQAFGFATTAGEICNAIIMFCSPG